MAWDPGEGRPNRASQEQISELWGKIHELERELRSKKKHIYKILDKNTGENMTEYTLEQAIKRCKENGGAIRRMGETTKIVSDHLKINPQFFSVTDIAATWIYEPPKQSAFQKWQKSQHESGKAYDQYIARKEGWNAAIDEVKKICKTPESSDRFVLSGKFIEELKEP